MDRDPFSSFTEHAPSAADIETALERREIERDWPQVRRVLKFWTDTGRVRLDFQLLRDGNTEVTRYASDAPGWRFGLMNRT